MKRLAVPGILQNTPFHMIESDAPDVMHGALEISALFTIKL
jgi:hypothetical protein